MPGKGVITLRCPECGSELVVDAASGDVLEHRPVQPKSRSVDLSRTEDLLRRERQQREERFQAAIAAEKRRDDVLSRKFDRGLERAREHPGEPRPLRDLDLD